MEKLIAVAFGRTMARLFALVDCCTRWQSSLSQPFVEENFDFFGRTLGGTKELQPRWRRCSIYADIDLGEAVGQAYVAKYFPPENKERMLQMVKAIKTALDQDIDAATWMSDADQEGGARQAGSAGRQDRISRPLARLLFGRDQARRLSGQRAAGVGFRDQAPHCASSASPRTATSGA